MARVVWSLTARRDLRAIREYIGLDSRDAAEVFVRLIIAAAKRAGPFPRLGRVVPEYKDESVREILYQNYRIIYILRGNRVQVARVIHGSMDMRRLQIDRS